MQYAASGPERGLLRVWSIPRLHALAASLKVFHLPVDGVAALDCDVWFRGSGEQPTVRLVALHALRIYESDLAAPVILSSDGSILDGLHRIARAWLIGLPVVNAVRFAVDPEPDIIVTEEEFRALCTDNR